MVEAQIVNIGEARMSVYDAGSGTPIIFLHGNASRWQHWEPQLRALTGRFRCIAFDQRGYGASSPLTGKTSLSLMADDTAAVLHALGVDHAFFVGLSTGGEVAQAVAIRHPELVAGLVLAGRAWRGGPRLEPALTGIAIFVNQETAFAGSEICDASESSGAADWERTS